MVTNREVSPRAELSVEGSVEWSVCAKQLSLGPVGLGVLRGHVGEWALVIESFRRRASRRAQQGAH